METSSPLWAALAFAALLGLTIAALLVRRLSVTLQRERAQRAHLLQEDQRRTQAEAVWSTVAQTIIGRQSLDEVLKTVIQIINEKVNVETGSILLRDPGSDDLRFAKVLSGNQEQFQSIRVAVGQGVAGWVTQTGQPALVTNARSDPRFFYEIDRQTGFKTQSILCVPLIVKEKTIGVIELLNKRDGNFNHDDLRLLELIAAPIAVAIQNARLDQRVQEQIVEVTDLLQKVERAKKEWENTIDALAAGISLVDAECRILRVNRTLAKWLNTTPAALVGQYCYRAIYGQNERLAYCANAKNAGEPAQSFEWEMEEPQLKGTFHFSTFPLHEPNGSPIGAVNVIADITMEKRLQAELIKNQKLSATGRLAASLAHEINNPLQAIQSCLELAKNNAVDAVKQERYLNMATGELERLTHIVQQMLEFNRPGKGDRTQIDVVGLVDDVLALSAKRIQNAQVVVETDLAEPIPHIVGVGNQLRQVFLNLILNAVEAMPHGGRLRISVQAEANEPPWVTVAFADTGNGIPADAIDKIFEPFFTGKPAGTGLGLAVCHQIITNHDGRITVESAVGRGSTFTVWLPARPGSTRSEASR